MNPFSKPLDIYGDAYDPGVNGHDLSRKDIQCIWICKNLNSGGSCFMANGDLLNLTVFTNKEVHVLERRLEPYISYVFQLICTKLDVTNYDEASVIITEIDLPALAVDVPLAISQRRINLNEEIIFRLNYTGNSPDNIFYAGALVYDYDVVATMIFQYLDFKFKIWDYFNNFTTIDKLSIRCSVYDPRFYMPSVTSMDLLFNWPPAACKFSVSANNNLYQEYSTLFSLSVNECTDSDQPLSYKFSYYLSEQLFR